MRRGPGDPENMVTAEEIWDAYAGAMGNLPRSGVVEVMDVVWWMTGLSPTKYDVEQVPDLAAWKIVKREATTPMLLGVDRG